jgi:Ca2+-binding EF-hand superfamily protein
MVACSLAFAEPDISDINLTETCTNPMINLVKKKKADEQGIVEAVNIFKQHDLNKDNLICFDEIKRVAPQTLNKWSKFDLNKDLCVTPLEAKTVIERDIMHRWKRQHRSLDINRDGNIQERELKLRFRDADENSFTVADFWEVYDINFDKVVSEPEYIEGSISYLNEIRKISPQFRVEHQSRLRHSSAKTLRSTP